MDEKSTHKAAVENAMNDVKAQIKSCSDVIKELKQERKEQIKLINQKHKESLKFIDIAQTRLNGTLKKLKKFQKNPNVQLDDIVLLQKTKNTSGAPKKAAKLERKNSEKELKKAAKLERKNSEKELKEAEKAAKLERKNSAKDLKEAEKAAKLERKNSEKELKEIRKLERKNSEKELKEAIKREETEAKKAALFLKNKSPVEFSPNKRAALLVSTNDTKKRSAIASMRNFLTEHIGFEDNEIISLSNITKTATKMKILEQLDTVIEQANEKGFNEVWFFYSGDSIMVKDIKEEDYEDVIVPSDYKEKGIINSMTFNSRIENISKNVKVILLFDCCHNKNFLETAYEYSGGSDIKNCFSVSRNYNANITAFSLRTIEPSFNKRGIIPNENEHILARTFIEHYNECVEDNCSAVSVFSMLNDIRDYMLFNEIELIPVLYCPKEIKNESILIPIQ